MLTFASPAKINLSLDITGVRADGYHELQSVVHCIGLYDYLTFDFTCAPGIEFSCSDKTLETETNLVCAAGRAWLEAAADLGQTDFAGVRIHLQKNIPAGAGLGGGSGNAATTLLAFNKQHRDLLNEEQLQNIAARLGADVPLFLKGGCVLMEGIGEHLSTLPAIEGAVVLIVPNQHASTPAVYRRFDEMEISSTRSTPALLEAIKQKDFSSIANALGNDLQLAAQSLGIDTQLPIALLKKHGAKGAQMSGSGAASFGLFENEAQANHAARKIREDSYLPKEYKIFAAPLIEAAAKTQGRETNKS